MNNNNMIKNFIAVLSTLLLLSSPYLFRFLYQASAQDFDGKRVLIYSGVFTFLVPIYTLLIVSYRNIVPLIVGLGFIVLAFVGVKLAELFYMYNAFVLLALGVFLTGYYLWQVANERED